MSEGRWDVYVRDMLACCTRIEDHTAGLSRDGLIGSHLIYDAVLWNIAAWVDITGTRNRIVHGYGSLREQIVWEIVSSDIPDLIPQLRALLEDAESQGTASPPPA